MELEALKFTLNQLYKQYLIPFFLINDNKKIIFPNTVWSAQDISPKYLNKPHNNEVNFFKNNSFYYSSFTYELPELGAGTVLIGPCGSLDTGSNTIHFQEHTYIAGIHYKKTSKEDFENFVEIIFSIIRGTLLPDKKHWFYDKHENSTNSTLEQNLQSRRSTQNTIDSYEFELRYVEAIRRNEPEKIKWLFKKMSDTYTAKLSNSELESLKFKYAGLITILTRTSISEGVPVDQAFSLSDALLQRLNNINSYEECLTYVEESSYKFSNLICSYPYTLKSNSIRSVLNYIDDHIYERITVESLSKYINMHRTSLSNKFKKEVGQTIHEYVNNKKIKEAEHLLLFTEISYKDISTLLGFASQSHFIQTFKHFTGETPLDYRNNRLTYNFK